MKVIWKAVLAVAIVSTMTACGTAESSSNATYQIVEVVEEETPIEQNAESFIVDKQIYSDDQFDLYCKEIRSNGIIFECNNKTSQDILMQYSIALDRIIQNIWSSVDECTIPAGEKKEFICNSLEMTNCEHKTISISGIGFVDGSEYLSFDLVDFDLGGNSSPDILADGTSVYESEVINISYIGTFTEGLEFKVHNKIEDTVNFSTQVFNVNGASDGYGSVLKLPGYTTGIFKYYITNCNIDDVNTFEGALYADIPEYGYVQLCDVNYDNGEIESKDITPNISLGDTIEDSPVKEEKNEQEQSEQQKVREEVQDKSSETQEAFDTAVNMTKDDLTYKNGKWEYQGLPLLKEDCEWIEDSLNTNRTVEAGAIYRKVGYLLEGFESNLNNGKNYCDMVFGVPFESRDALIPYVENMKDLYAEQYPIVSVMKKFEKLSSLSGEFNFDSGKLGKYSFKIDDTAACAKELMISEKMLGYTLAMLTEYAADIQFEGNSCTVVYEGF